MPPLRNPEHEMSSVWQRVNIFGSLVGMAALGLFIVAWNQVPDVGCSAPCMYITMTIDIVIFVVFVLTKKRVLQALICFGVLEIKPFFTWASISTGWPSFSIDIGICLSTRPSWPSSSFPRIWTRSSLPPPSS
ncbi:hypothetical protein BGZ63DRAFT_425511 [Mariannaea sp. PMI_226]|nr:hypothetical protein BGZ63DRAFT_425511 [Mariannaea sp. PMI_226]